MNAEHLENRATIAPLRGHVVGVTADRRVADQVMLLEWAGARCVPARAVETVAVGSLDSYRRLIEDLAAERPDIVIVTTDVGVRYWFDAAAVLGCDETLREVISQAEVLARGTTALSTLRSLGVEPRMASDFANYDAMLQELKSRDAGPRRCVVQLDGAGAPSLCEGLDELGAKVLPVSIYRSTLPADLAELERLVAAACDGRVDALTFAARPAAENFLDVVGQLGLQDRFSSAVESGALVCFSIGTGCTESFLAAGLPLPQISSGPSLGSLVEAVVTHFGAAGREIMLGGFSIRIQGRTVQVAGQQAVELTQRERAVLAVLVERPGVVHDKRSLLATVWRGTHTDEHLVEVTIGRLRQRLGVAGVGIETVVRRGYRASAT